MSTFSDRLYISTMADDAPELAARYGLGLEIADFCTAINMDRLFEEKNAEVVRKMQCAGRFTFHAAFNELCPAAIDPVVRRHTAARYDQAVALAGSYGIRKVIIHTGFIPLVYFPEWFVPESVKFWKEFLSGVPEDMVLCLENVMEPGPEIQAGILGAVDDPRLRACLDIGHANTRISHTPAEKWIDVLSPYLAHLHIHNNDGDMDLHHPLGQGTMDIAALLDRTERAAPDATYAIENLSAGSSLLWLEEHQYI